MAKRRSYLFHQPIELGQYVEEWNLRDDELLLLILVEGSGGEVQAQVHESGLHHFFLILFIPEQLLLFFGRLKQSNTVS